MNVSHEYVVPRSIPIGGASLEAIVKVDARCYCPLIRPYGVSKHTSRFNLLKLVWSKGIL